MFTKPLCFDIILSVFRKAAAAAADQQDRQSKGPRQSAVHGGRNMTIGELIGRTGYKAAEPTKDIKKDRREEQQLQARLKLAGYCPKETGKSWSHNPREKGKAGNGPGKPDRPGGGNEQRQI